MTQKITLITNIGIDIQLGYATLEMTIENIKYYALMEFSNDITHINIFYGNIEDDNTITKMKLNNTNLDTIFWHCFTIICNYKSVDNASAYAKLLGKLLYNAKFYLNTKKGK